jgi:hypothetical protein
MTDLGCFLLSPCVHMLCHGCIVKLTGTSLCYAVLHRACYLLQVSLTVSSAAAAVAAGSAGST